ncbi:CAP domain-containing protein [Aspergillus navahoensis]
MRGKMLGQQKLHLINPCLLTPEMPSSILQHRHHQPTLPLILTVLHLLKIPTLLLLLLPHAISATETTVIVTITETATATATATIMTTPKVPQDPSYTSASQFKSSILKTTNAYRAAHNASDLSWSEALADYAKDWARECRWAHSSGPYGENLAYGYRTASSAVTAWGGEAALYDFSKPTGFTEDTGHFTQLVWKSTREVGCAAVDCGLTELDDGDEEERERAQGWYVVCEYMPAGNVVGTNGGLEYFRLNVQEGSEEDSGPNSEDEGEHRDGDDDGVDVSGAGDSASRGLMGRGIMRVEWWVGIVLYILSSV